MYNYDIDEKNDIAWCPGCGNFSIRQSFIKALEELNINPTELVLTSGIGQAAKMPQYINANYFNGLHGRGLPLAVAVKMCNTNLIVISFGGDGDMYGEGGNHFIHNIRRNVDITHIVHNNMVYGLTKGQASPTSQMGFVTPVQNDGVINEPFSPLMTALSLGATFVARAFSGDIEKTKDIIKEAIMHKGYALVDIFQPCVSFNKINTFKWYRENSYYLSENHDTGSLKDAFDVVSGEKKYALGIIYKKNNVPAYCDKSNVYEKSKEPIIFRKRDMEKVNNLL